MKPLIIFMHGLGASNRSFRPLAEQLKDLETEFEFAAFDFRGFGGTPVPETAKNVSMRLYAEQLAQVIAEHNPDKIRSVHLIAHSMGGSVTVEMHRLFPEIRISSFVNLEGNLQLEDCTTSKEVSQQGREKFCKSQFNTFKEEIRKRARGGDTGAEDWIHGLEATTAEVFYDASLDLVRVSAHLYPVYRDWDTRTVYVFGENTLKSLKGTYERLLKDGKDVAVIPNAAHVMHLEQPRATAEICRKHIWPISCKPHANTL